MKWMCASLGLLIVAGWLAHAEPADEKQAPRATLTPTTNPQERVGIGNNLRRPFFGPPTEKQIEDADAFISIHSPNRFKAYQNKPGIHRAMVQGYLQLQAIKNQDAELYKMKLDELSFEDTIFGVLSEARSSEKGIDRPALREQLRPLVKQLVDKRVEEAQHRLDRMQHALDHEKANLDILKRDTANLDARVEQEINSGGRPLGIVGAGGRPVPPHAEKPPTTSAVNADQAH